MSYREFEIDEEQEDGALRVKVRGELDLATAPVVEERLGRLAAAAHAVRLDLSELEFMDSSGIRTLVNARRAEGGNGWRLEVLPNFRPQVSRVLSLAQVDRMISGSHDNGG